MSENLSLHNLISCVISFKSVSIKSPELYEFVVSYFSYKNFSVKDLEEYKNHGRVIKFFNSIATMHGNWNNQYFLGVVGDYIDKYYSEFSGFQKISLDLFKFFIHFENDELKKKLAKANHMF